MNCTTLKRLAAPLLCLSVSILLFSAGALANNDSKGLDELVETDERPLDRALNGGVVSYAESVSEARKAVVSIASRRVVDLSDRGGDDPFWRFFGRNMPPREMQGLGSGVIVTENGYILTNSHVVDKADEVTVTLQDGDTHEAEVIGTDPQTDIAVLKIEADGLPKATLANSDSIEVGDVAFAIGNPLGVGQTVTMGIISAKGRNQLNMIENGYENFIQTDASINQGNSGGALVDAYGRVLGINTMILTDGRSTGNIGIGFAVPVNMAYHVMSSLVESGSVTRGFLGVGIQELTQDLAESFGLDDAEGVLVTEVMSNSPAAEAGLQQGDVIVGVDGQEVGSTSELRLNIANRRPGSEVEILVSRDQEERRFAATLVEFGADGMSVGMADEEGGELLKGVTAEPLTPLLREQFGVEEDVQGLVVTDVSPESPHRRDLQVGLVIQKVKNQAIRTVEEAKQLMEPGRKVALFVYVDGLHRYIAIEVE